MSDGKNNDEMSLLKLLRKCCRRRGVLLQEAEKSIKLRDEILAIVSHDIRNPLAIISGFNQLMIEHLHQTNSSDEVLEGCHAISRSVKQIERLITDLLDFSKIESDTLRLEKRRMTATELIADAIAGVNHLAHSKNMKILNHCKNDSAGVFCDPDRINQVLTNLLVNAIKYSSCNTTLQIDTVQVENQLCFSVKDNGQGIKSSELPYIFDRYWQSQNASKCGTGLGLTICRGIVENHDGRIWAESEVGKGTTVYFTLPVFRTDVVAPTYSAPVPVKDELIFH